MKISGELVAREVNILSKKFESLGKGKCNTVVVDLSETNYIDSHGLGVFVYAWKMFEQKNKELIFLNPQGFIRDMFMGTNLNQILRVVDNLEEL